MQSSFIERKHGYLRFSFECPACDAVGEVAIPTSKENQVIGHGCGALFIVQPVAGMFAKPQLVCVNEVAQ